MKRLKSYSIYESRRLLILVARDEDEEGKGAFRIIEIKRSSGAVLSLNEDSTKLYSDEELQEYIRSAKVSVLFDRVYCLFGFVRLVESYYLIAVVNASVVASIHGHDIYTVMGTSLIPVNYMPRKTIEETRYKTLLNSIDMTNHYYFSYTYDLTSSMQRKESQRVVEIQDMFVWNHHASEPFQFLERESAVAGEGSKHTWVMPIILGYVRQKSADFQAGRGNYKKLNKNDTHNLRLLTYTLISRRSRHFAGTRYLRRGVNDQGFVANEVETEQVITICMEKVKDIHGDSISGVGPAPENFVYAETPERSKYSYRSSSMVQVRGSIPLYWHHINLLSPAPDVVMENMPAGTLMNSTDAEEESKEKEACLYSYPAARLHFKRLYSRYGGHVDLLNLVKLRSSKREVTLGRAYVDLCNDLTPSLALEFEGVSDKKKMKKKKKGEEMEEEIQDEIGDEEVDDGVDTEDEGEEGITATGRGTEPSSIPSNTSTNAEENTKEVSLGNEDDYALTYRCFDLLHAHEKEEKESAKATSGTVEVEAASATAEHVDIFTTLAEYANEYIARTGFYVQAPEAPKGKDKTEEEDEGAANFLSFPLGPEQADQLGLLPGSFQAADEADAASSASAGTGAYNLDDIDITHSSEHHTWRDSAMEDITSWIADGRLRLGTKCKVLQRGVLRTNCVDCLDRTNIAQFVHAKQSLVLQCRALGVELTSLGLYHFLQMVTDLWSRHGNYLAIQYGGSGAMHSLALETPANLPATIVKSGSVNEVGSEAVWTMRPSEDEEGLSRSETEGPHSYSNPNLNPGTSSEEPHTSAADDIPTETSSSSSSSHPVFKLTGGIKNGLVAVNRYYANVTTDYEKQQAIDLLLGMFVPVKGAAGIWEFDLQPQYHRSSLASYREPNRDVEEEVNSGIGGSAGTGVLGSVLQDPLVLVGRGFLWS